MAVPVALTVFLWLTTFTSLSSAEMAFISELAPCALQNSFNLQEFALGGNRSKINEMLFLTLSHHLMDNILITLLFPKGW